MRKNSLFKKSIALLAASIIAFSASFVFDIYADNAINPSVNGDSYTYEVEQGTLVKNSYVSQTIQNYSGTGSVNILDSGSAVTMNINVSVAGNYKIYVYGSNDDGNNKCDYFSVNNGTDYLIAIPASAKNTWVSAEPGTEKWDGGVLKPNPIESGFAFNAGVNTIKISVNWGYAYYDKVVLEKISADDATTAVINKISALSEKVTESERTNIEKAKTAYDALTSAQKSLVTNYSKLETILNILNPAVQEPQVSNDVYSYETEICSYPNNSCYTDTAISGYSGSGYVYIMEGTIRIRLNVLSAGNYKISIVSANNDGSDKCDYVIINDDKKYFVATPATANKAWNTSEIGTENYLDGKISPKPVEGGILLNKGINVVEISANWGYCAYDKIILEKIEINDPASVAVIAQIDELPEKVTESERAKIEKAKTAYDALTSAQKSLVTNYSKLETILNILNPAVQEPQVSNDVYSYETEICSYPNNSCYTDTAISGYSGNGYVYIMEGTIRTRLNVLSGGNYKISIVSANSDGSDKCDYVIINDDKEYLVATPATANNTWNTSEIGTENYLDGKISPQPVDGGIELNEGINVVEISANWGYCAYDKIILEKIEPNNPAVLAVIADINKLPEKVTESARAQIEKAKTAYDALTSAQKSLVTNYNVLETKLNILNPAIQEPQVKNGIYLYEAEICSYPNNSCYTDTAISGYSGSGYVYIMEGAIRTRLNVPEAGKYSIFIASANNDGLAKCDNVTVNDSNTYLIATSANPKNTWILNQIGRENWVDNQLKPLEPKDGIILEKGVNIVEISANWGYCAYDKIVLVPSDINGIIDETSVAEINKLIAELPNVIEAEHISKVIEITNLYNSLNDKDKTFIKDVEKLFRSNAMVNALNADKKVYKGTMRYECEDGKMTGNSSVVTEKSVFSSFSGQGYVFLFDKSFDVDVYVEKDGYYHINIISGTDENASKCDFFQINNGDKYLIATNGEKGVWKYSVPGTEYWTNGKLTPQAPQKGYYLKAGKNTLTISANWGYCSYDAIEIYPQGVSPKTGDFENENDLLLTMFIMVISFSGLVILGKKIKS